MNKEETKQAILGFTEFFKGITGNQDLKIPDDIAKEYGIETALNQEPCEDCISRQAVKDILDARGVKAIMTFEHFKELLDDLPPVTPQPKTGYWTPGERICSCCGEDKFKDLDADIWADWYPKFCPNCGTKMEIKENEG